MKTYLVKFLPLLALVMFVACGGPTDASPQSPSPATPRDACDAFSPADIARILQVDEGAITEARGEAHEFGENKSDCKWLFEESAIQTDVVVHITQRTDKMKGEDPLGSRLQYFIASGEKVGSSKQLTYRAFEIPELEVSALSEDFAFNKYSRMRSLAWTRGGHFFYKLTLTHTLADLGAQLPAIDAETMGTLAQNVAE